MPGWAGEQRQEKDGGEEGKERGSCEEEGKRKEPDACEMKRIKGLHTSRRGRKMCGGRSERLKMGGGKRGEEEATEQQRERLARQQEAC